MTRHDADSGQPSTLRTKLDYGESPMPGFSPAAILGFGKDDPTGKDLSWIGDYSDELAVSIAMRMFEEAVVLVEKGASPFAVDPADTLRQARRSSLISPATHTAHSSSALSSMNAPPSWSPPSCKISRTIRSASRASWRARCGSSDWVKANALARRSSWVEELLCAKEPVRSSSRGTLACTSPSSRWCASP